jgi:hypothetical protein
MSKAKKALIIIGAIISVPVITVIGLSLYWNVYLPATFAAQMKNGGHIDPKNTRMFFIRMN